MRRILLVLAVAALMGAMVIAPGVAGAQENVSQSCKQEQAEMSFPSHGGCVSLFNAGTHTTANKANACHDRDFVAFIESIHGELKNHGQCMKVLNPGTKPDA